MRGSTHSITDFERLHHSPSSDHYSSLLNQETQTLRASVQAADERSACLTHDGYSTPPRAKQAPCRACFKQFSNSVCWANHQLFNAGAHVSKVPAAW